jgi:pantetheine-phosphate adenylyltransferase
MERWVVRLAVYAGSFDPFTYGHLSVLRGALKAFDHVVIAIGHNSVKKRTFDIAERSLIVQDYVETHMPNGLKPGGQVAVRIFDGLLVDFCRSILNKPVLDGQPSTIPDSVCIVRGLRAVSDFEQEMGIADANRRLSSQFQTLFIPTEADLAFCSSSIVRELAAHKSWEALKSYVLPSVIDRFKHHVPA